MTIQAWELKWWPALRVTRSIQTLSWRTRKACFILSMKQTRMLAEPARCVARRVRSPDAKISAASRFDKRKTRQAPRSRFPKVRAGSEEWAGDLTRRATQRDFQK